MDLLGCLIGVAQGVGQARAGGGHAQHTAAVGHKRAVLGEGRTGVIHRHILFVRQLTVHQAGDGLALLVGHRVAAGSEDDAGSRAVGELHLGVGQRALGAGGHDLEQVAFQQGQHHLSLRIAEAAVVLDDLRAVRGAKIGMIFQDAGASLCPIRTIGEQIYESMRAHGKIVKAEAKEHALELLTKLNFKEPERIWESYPFEMSGGMNQRAGIAISMLMNPPVLFADEPTSALDVAVQRQVVQEMLHVRELFGTAIIIVTHDIGVVSAMADTVLVLKDGRKMEYGPAKEVLEHPQNDYTKELLSAVPKLKRS